MCSSKSSIEELGREITQLASHIHAATCCWLALIAEFDAREGWADWGCRSCAEWVSWRCGVAPVAAREHVRVARRLAELPLVRAAFAEGRLSYSKVRALTRVEEVEREQDLLELASHATAAQLERLVRAYRGVVAVERAAHDGHADRWLTWDYDDDGSVRLRGRLPAEEGALVIAALEAAREQARTEATTTRASAEALARTADEAGGAALADASAEAQALTSGAGGPVPPGASAEALALEAGEADGSSADASAEAPGRAEGQSDEVAMADASAEALARGAGEGGGAGVVDASAEAPRLTAAEARADALVAMAETLLATGPAARHGGDRHQVVVHVDAATLRGRTRGDRCELDSGAPLAAETARRLACDAAVVPLIERAGQPLSVGRKTRSIPPALRRALASRDRGCRFPGCTADRFVDAHHIQHWAHGGATSLENLVQLCRHHHRLLHEGGYAVGEDEGRLTFRRPDGRRVVACPRPPRGHPDRLGTPRAIPPDACRSLSEGQRMDLDMAVDALLTFAPPPSVLPEPPGV